MTDTPGKDALPTNARRIPIPAAALGPWLAEIDDATELKVTLRALALLAEGVNRRGVPPSLALHDLLDDPFLAQGCTGENIRRGLAAALVRGTLLAALDRDEARVFLNDDGSERHLERSALRPLSPTHVLEGPVASALNQRLPHTQQDAGRDSVFALYEKHFGLYGHSVAEQLKAAEAEYPASWIADAIATAVEQNARSWSYVHAILRRWLQEGKPTGSATTTDQQRGYSHEHGKLGIDPAQDDRTGYIESFRRRHGRLPWEPSEPTRRTNN